MNLSEWVRGNLEVYVNKSNVSETERMLLRAGGEIDRVENDKVEG